MANNPPNQPTNDLDPLDALVAEFLERRQQGESVSIEAFAEAHPEQAAAIREVFPTMLLLEEAREVRSASYGASPARGRVDQEQLGDYRLVREIGRGGMGIVYEAEQESLGRRVAVKVLPQHLLADEKQVRRFEREARTAARLHHSNIVPIFGVGRHENYHYYVMQYIRGVGLDRVLHELRGRLAGQTNDDPQPSEVDAGARRSGNVDAFSVGRVLARRFTERVREEGEAGTTGTGDTQTRSEEATTRRNLLDAGAPGANVPSAASNPEHVGNAVTLRAAHFRHVAEIGVQVADALAYAHAQGTLHRDVKPANLLLDADGVVWVADFGLAKAIEHGELTQAGDIVGTLRYMAPEQFEGVADPRCDIYSLGISLYEMATLRPAFADASRGALIEAVKRGQLAPPRTHAPGIPRDLETVLLKALALDPHDRYASAAELAADLRRFLSDRPVRARRVTPIEHAWRWARRNPVMAGLTTTVLTLLVVVAVMASIGYVLAQRASKDIHDSWMSEQRQRLRAESVSNLALSALDTIFDRLAPPQGTLTTLSTALHGEEDESIKVPVAPAISRETAELLEDLLAFYEQLAAQDGTLALKPKIADATFRLAQLHQRLGQFDTAREVYAQAGAIVGELHDRQPGEPAHTVLLAQIENRRGEMLAAEDAFEAARAAHRNAYALLRGNGAMPRNPALRYALAETCVLLARAPESAMLTAGPHGPGGPPGHLQPPPWLHDLLGMRGGPEEGRPAPDGAKNDLPTDERIRLLEEAAALLRELINAQPHEVAYQRLLAQCYCAWPPHTAIERQTGSIGENDDSTAPPRERGLALLEELVSRHPAVPEYRFDLAVAYASEEPHGPWRFGRNDEDRTETRLRRAVALLETLIDERPNVPSYAQQYVRAAHKLGRYLERGNRLGDAAAAFEKALARQRSLVSRHPTVDSHIAGMALVEVSRAELYLREDALDQAEALLHSALTRLDIVAFNAPDGPAYLRGLQRHAERVLDEVDWRREHPDLPRPPEWPRGPRPGSSPEDPPGPPPRRLPGAPE